MVHFLICFNVMFSFINSKFSFMVLLKTNGSCLIIDICFLNSSSFKSLIFILSINISPSFASKILVSKLNMVLFPCPDAPTIAIFLLGSILILKFFNIFSSSGYENVTFLNSIIPLMLGSSLLPNVSSLYSLFSSISLYLAY